MKILIDDIRNIEGMDIIIRNYEHAKMITPLLFYNNEIHLFLDHDLGGEKTGYHFICYLIENALTWAEEDYKVHSFMPTRVTIVSANPVGRQNIERALNNFGYRKVKGDWVLNED